jgi:NAD(P)-dependent dehydrogenase (short-subunit alcohol dehydrogenase family)
MNSQLVKKVDIIKNDGVGEEMVYCVQADLTKPEDIRRVVEVGMARFGQIDHVVNAAADLKFHGKLKELWFYNSYAAQQMFINSISPMLELQPYQVRVNTICPGTFINDTYVNKILSKMKYLIEEPMITGQIITEF